jgi:hypothetical protein
MLILSLLPFAICAHAFLGVDLGDMASVTVKSGSLADLPNLANTSLYGFEDYHGVDCGHGRGEGLAHLVHGGRRRNACRDHPREGDTKLGFAIDRTEEVRKYAWHCRTARDVPACRHTSEL